MRIKKAFCLVGLLVFLLAACGGPGGPSSSGGASSHPYGSIPIPGASSDASSETSSGASSSTAETVKFVVPEGYTLARIGMALEEAGFGTAAEFIETCQTGDFSEFPLVAAQQENPNRCFKLEGYLFPATYELRPGMGHDEIIRMMLRAFEQRMDDALRTQVEASPYTMDEILALASIIEKEAYGPAEMENISSVLHNRLGTGMKLQCDVTIKYVEGAIKPFITGDENRYNEYYNTYKCPALPAGAICNPGKAAILAALNPADTPYFYFLTDANHKYYYAATFEEHQENKKEAGIA